MNGDSSFETRITANQIRELGLNNGERRKIIVFPLATCGKNKHKNGNLNSNNNNKHVTNIEINKEDDDKIMNKIKKVVEENKLMVAALGGVVALLGAYLLYMMYRKKCEKEKNCKELKGLKFIKDKLAMFSLDNDKKEEVEEDIIVSDEDDKYGKTTCHPQVHKKKNEHRVSFDDMEIDTLDRPDIKTYKKAEKEYKIEDDEHMDDIYE